VCRAGQQRAQSRPVELVVRRAPGLLQRAQRKVQLRLAQLERVSRGLLLGGDLGAQGVAAAALRRRYAVVEAHRALSEAHAYGPNVRDGP